MHHRFAGTGRGKALPYHIRSIGTDKLPNLPRCGAGRIPGRIGLAVIALIPARPIDPEQSHVVIVGSIQLQGTNGQPPPGQDQGTVAREEACGRVEIGCIAPHGRGGDILEAAILQQVLRAGGQGKCQQKRSGKTGRHSGNVFHFFFLYFWSLTTGYDP